MAPDVIDRYFEADARGDTDAVVALFTDDAVVVDEGRTWEGSAGVREWRLGPASKFEYTTTVLDRSDPGAVRVRLDGNFPGGTVDLTFAFSVSADRIANLRIEP